MKFDPRIHHRKSIRHKGFDYSQVGLYFITICTENRICQFGNIEKNEMILNEYGRIAYNNWIQLSNRFPNCEIDVFQIMPNHIHGILKLNLLSSNNEIKKSTVKDIVGAYKSLVSNNCLEIYKSKNELMGKFWQRNYYEHIIRNDTSYQLISDYIKANPAKWHEDKLYIL